MRFKNLFKPQVRYMISDITAALFSHVTRASAVSDRSVHHMIKQSYLFKASFRAKFLLICSMHITVKHVSLNG